MNEILQLLHYVYNVTIIRPEIILLCSLFATEKDNKVEAMLILMI